MSGSSSSNLCARGLLLAAAGLAFAPSTAVAQDPGAFTFDLNSVLVSTFEADQPFLEPEAERVRRLVEGALGASYVVLTMAEVPPFTDYSADVYLRSCPDGQYIGCVFVVGGRAETDWTIGGRVGAVEGGYKVNLSFIDVSEAKLVLEFDVTLDGSNDGEFKEGVLRVMDALVAGSVQDLDLRGDPEAERAAQAEADRRAGEARQFAADSVYEDLGEFERGDVGADARGSSSRSSSGRVTADDMEESENSGGLTPWERVGLTKAQYRLYKNSGKKLRDFKVRLQGRRGELLVRAALDVLNGPYGQAHDTAYELIAGANRDQAPTKDEILSQTAIQLQTNALVFGGQFELGFGVAKWLEIMAFAGLQSTPYQYRRTIDQAGVQQVTTEPKRTSRVGWNAGLKLGFIPMPAYPARPTLHLGASYWTGSSINSIERYPSSLYASQMRGNNMILVHVQPGFEVNAGKLVTVFGRFNLDVPVLGRTFQRITTSTYPAFPRERDLAAAYPQGGMFALERGTFTPAFGLGIGGQVGICFRFRVAGQR